MLPAAQFADPCARPPAPTIYTEALRLAVDLVRTPQVADRYTGLKAYEVLASALREQEFPEDAERKEDELGFRYLCILCYNMMLDDHRWAAPFLRDAAEALPECGTELLRAADCYERSCEPRNQLEGIAKSDFSPDAQRRLLAPDVRDDYARTILRIRDGDEQGISHIEQALGAEGVDLPAHAEGDPTPGEEHTQRGDAMENTADRLETERLVIRRFTRDEWADTQKLAIDMASSEAWKYDHGWPTEEDGCKGAADYPSRNGCFWSVRLKGGRPSARFRGGPAHLH